MAEQNDVQEWDESDESGDERNTALTENQQSDQQMATMSVDRQLNLSGPSQLGGGNTQNINPDNSNSNNVVYNNCTFLYVENYSPNGKQSQQMAHSFQDEGGHQPPRPSDLPSAGRLTEQCLQHMHNRIQAQSSWTGSRCPYCGSPTLPDQSPPTPSQPVATGSSQTPAPTPSSCPQGQSQMKQINDGIVRSRCSTDSRQDIRPQADQKRENKQQRRSKRKQQTDEESKSQLARCPVSTETNALPAIETEDIQATPIETPDSVTIVDECGRELKPGDGVLVEPDRRSSGYFGIYVGGRDVIRCDGKTQEVKMEMMDVSKTFNRLTPSSESRCKIFPAQMRAERARSYVGRLSPVEEAWCGRDFMYWTFTGLNCHQAGKKGFNLSVDLTGGGGERQEVNLSEFFYRISRVIESVLYKK